MMFRQVRMTSKRWLAMLVMGALLVVGSAAPLQAADLYRSVRFNIPPCCDGGIYTVGTDGSHGIAVSHPEGNFVSNGGGGLAFDPRGTGTIFVMQPESGGSDFFTFDGTTPGVETFGPVRVSGPSIGALAWNHNSHTLWGMGGAGTSNLFQLNPSTGEEISAVDTTIRGDGLAYAKGHFYLFSEPTGDIWRIDDPTTGAVSFLATVTGLAGNASGLAFDLQTDRLYAGSGTASNNFMYSVTLGGVVGPAIPLEDPPFPAGHTSIRDTAYGLAPTVVPEPATMALVGVGAVLALGRRRRA